MNDANSNTGITDDDIKKAKEYKQALDQLKNSVVGLNSKLPEFADGKQKCQADDRVNFHEV